MTSPCAKDPGSFLCPLYICGHEECIVPAEVRSYLSRFFSLLLSALICKVGKKGDLLHTVRMGGGSFSNSLGTIPVT